MSIDIEKVRARANRAASSFPTGALSTPLHDQLREALADVPALLDEVERQERAVEALVRIRNQQAERAEKAEAECDRLRAAVGAVKALVAKGWVDFHNTEVTVDLPAIRAVLNLGEG